MQMLIYILKRILQTIPLLIIVSLISFFIIRLSPVDPLAELKLNPSVSKETLQKETERLGLDDIVEFTGRVSDEKLLDYLNTDRKSVV